MITSNPERIDKLTRAGVWGDDTLHQLLTHHVAERPDMLAVADQPNRKELTPGNNARLSFRELDQASDALATALLEAGLEADDRVIVQLPNIAELVVCYYAASKLGIVLSPIPVQYGAHELRHVAAEINAQALITCERFKSTMLAREAKMAGRSSQPGSSRNPDRSPVSSSIRYSENGRLRMRASMFAW